MVAAVGAVSAASISSNSPVVDSKTKSDGGAPGLDEAQIDFLLAQEPTGRDDWAAFLILMPWSEIERLLDADEDAGYDPFDPD